MLNVVIQFNQRANQGKTRSALVSNSPTEFKQKPAILTINLILSHKKIDLLAVLHSSLRWSP